MADTARSPASERTLVFRILAGTFIPLLRLVCRVKVTGGEKIPQTGAFILSPNHITNLDPIVVGSVVWGLGRAPRFLTKAELFRVPVFGWFLRHSGQVPVERTGGSHGPGPLDAAARIAREGHAVIIYPEGSLTRDPELWPMRAKYGAVRMALAADIPIIPVAHWGDQHVLPAKTNRLHPIPRRTVTVVIGDPVDLSAYRGRPLDNQVLSDATADLMRAIAELLGGIRGEQPPLEVWKPAEHNQTEIGRF